jgi:hypothetical protein
MRFVLRHELECRSVRESLGDGYGVGCQRAQSWYIGGYEAPAPATSNQTPDIRYQTSNIWHQLGLTISHKRSRTGLGQSQSLLHRRHVSVGLDVWRVVRTTEVEQVDMGDDAASVSVALWVRRV